LRHIAGAEQIVWKFRKPPPAKMSPDSKPHSQIALIIYPSCKKRSVLWWTFSFSYWFQPSSKHIKEIKRASEQDKK